MAPALFHIIVVIVVAVDMCVHIYTHSIYYILLNI